MAELINCQKKLLNSQLGTEVSAKCVNIIRNCWINVNLYNLSTVAALEILYKDLSVLNSQNEGIFRICL